MLVLCGLPGCDELSNMIWVGVSVRNRSLGITGKASGYRIRIRVAKSDGYNLNDGCIRRGGGYDVRCTGCTCGGGCSGCVLGGGCAHLAMVVRWFFRVGQHQ